MTDAQRHNAPITPWMLTELAAVVGQVTGNKGVVQQHLILDERGHPTDIIFAVGDTGRMAMVYSAETALAYLRKLPTDVQNRAHWAAADNALVEAVRSVLGTDVSPAIRLFDAALAEDRKLDAKPVTIADKPVDDTARRAQQAKDDEAAKQRIKAEAEAKAAQPAPAPVS
jgi:hypothetical protein